MRTRRDELSQSPGKGAPLIQSGRRAAVAPLKKHTRCAFLVPGPPWLLLHVVLLHFMHQRILITFLFGTLTTLAFAQFVALSFSLYYRYPWIDIPMHILGGVTIAFIILLLPHLSLSIPHRYATFIPVMMGVLIAALMWELFEIQIGIPLLQNGFGLDMLKDIADGLVGGAVGYFVGQKMVTL